MRGLQTECQQDHELYSVDNMAATCQRVNSIFILLAAVLMWQFITQVHGESSAPEGVPAGVPTAQDDVSAGDSEDHAGRIRKDLEDSSLVRSSKPSYSYSYTQPTILYVPPSYQPGQYYYVLPQTTDYKTSHDKEEEKPLKVLDLSLATPSEYLHKTLVIKKPKLPVYHNPLLPLCKKIVALEESKTPETPQEHVYSYPSYPNYPNYPKY